MEQKVPVSLVKNLSASASDRLVRELKNSVLAKQLRTEIRSQIEATYAEEESTDSIEELWKLIGRRRGLRSILNLLPEKTK